MPPPPQFVTPVFHRSHATRHQGRARLLIEAHHACTGFHTFDYARHFLSCCSRMLGVEHVTSRGSIMLEYYGRNVGVKIMPTGVQPRRLLDILQSDDCKWRRGELQARCFIKDICRYDP